MEVITVEKLYNVLRDLVEQGKGDKVILVPNEFDEEINADYRTIGFIDTESDILNKYIYLETNISEDENAYFDSLEVE